MVWERGEGGRVGRREGGREGGGRREGRREGGREGGRKGGIGSESERRVRYVCRMLGTATLISL